MSFKVYRVKVTIPEQTTRSIVGTADGPEEAKRMAVECFLTELAENPDPAQACIVEELPEEIDIFDWPEDGDVFDDDEEES